MSAIITAWNGHYWRDRQGIWRYTLGNDAVPGARDRLLWDGVHVYPRMPLERTTYVCIPEGRLMPYPELSPVCAQEGVLCEVIEGCLTRYLVPEALWRPPTESHPEGGMWAPELEDLVTMQEFADMVGVNLQSLYNLGREGKFTAPVLKRKELGGWRTNYWSRVLATRWAAAYNARPEVRRCYRARLPIAQRRAP